MASLSVDGLISGLDTTSLIAQLVAAEGTAQTRLKTRLTETQKAAEAYRKINTKVDAVRTAAEALGKDATWTAAKATSSSSAVAVAVTGTPQTGSITFTVKSVAAAHAVVGSTAQPSTTTAGVYSGLTVYGPDGTTVKGTITVGTGSLDDTAAAINASSFGLQATVLQVSPGQYKLQVSARSTGAAGEFSLGSGFTELRQGKDAKIALGDSGGLEITSATNTFTGVVPGGTVTVTREDAAQVTVDVSADPDAVAAKVQAFVDAVNAALSEIATQSANGKDSAAALAGDSSLRQLTGQVLRAVSDVVAGLGSPGTYGIQLTRDGKVQFSKDTFLGALQADPATTRTAFAGTATGAPGVATRMQELAKRTTDATTGTLTLLARGRDDLAKDIQVRIADWDLRLAARKETLTRQFTAMETALSSLKSQSSWLAGQLSSLA
ncbi:flagellar filament capping protein FliD [Geodermatophilus sp. SYSU D01045]